MSILQAIFWMLKHDGLGEVAWNSNKDIDLACEEMLVFLALVPLSYTNLRAPLAPEISCSDASTHGGGAAVAQEFCSTFDHVDYEPVCVECGSQSNLVRCQWCGSSICTLLRGQHHWHQTCPKRTEELPRVHVFFAKSMLLHQAIFQQVLVVFWPGTGKHSDGFFTDEGRAEINLFVKRTSAVAEIWFLDDSMLEYYDEMGEPIRSAQHPMGLPWIRSTATKKALRHSNLKANFFCPAML